MKKNFIYNSLYQILILLLPMITAPYATRVLGPSNLGDYTYTQSVANYFVLFAMLGLNNYGNRSIATIRDDKVKLKKTFSEIVSMQWLVTAIVAAIYIISLVCFNNNFKYYYLVLLMYVISAGFDINWLFLGLEQFKINIVRNTIIKTLSVIAIFVFVKNSDDTLIYIIINCLGILLGQICVWPYAIKKIGFEIPNLKDILKHIKPNIILFIPVIAVSLYRIMDIIMLGKLCGNKEVAYYSYADKLIQIPLSLVTALTSVMMPRATNMIAKGEKTASKQLFDVALQLVLCMCSAFTFGMMGIADIFIPLYYGKAFMPSIVFLKFLAPVIFINGIASVIRTQFLIPMNEDKKYIYSVCTGAVVNFVLNFVLIKYIGSMGAVYATLFAELAVFCVQVILTKNEIQYRKYLLDSIVFLVIGFFMYLLISYIAFLSPIVTLMIRILGGMVIYTICTLLYLYKWRRETMICLIIEQFVEKLVRRKK